MNDDEKTEEYKNVEREFQGAVVVGWSVGKTLWKVIKVLFVLWIVFIISVIIFGSIVSETKEERLKNAEYFREHPEEHRVFSDPSVPDEVKDLLRESYENDSVIEPETEPLSSVDRKMKKINEYNERLREEKRNKIQIIGTGYKPLTRKESNEMAEEQLRIRQGYK